MPMDQSTARITATSADPIQRRDDDRAHHASKPLDEIEHDIARTRVRLGATIEALERELAPARVVVKGTEMLRGALEPGPGPFRDQVWAYAIPLALIASGLGWLIMLRRRGYEAHAPSSFGEMPGEAVETGETQAPQAPYADLAGPLEAEPLVGEETTI
jgi:hypothetical protein